MFSDYVTELIKHDLSQNTHSWANKPKIILNKKE